MIDPNLPRILTDIARVDAAFTIDELRALYVEIVGYDVFEDDPTATADSVRALLVGYLEEEASTYGG